MIRDPVRKNGESFRNMDGELAELPSNILSLEKIEELQTITRTERYLEIGAMVSLGNLITLGKTVPAALSQTIRGIAGPQVRNLATLGGNLCTGGDIAAPMAVLDARYEIRNAEGSRWIPAVRFGSFPDLRKQELLARIRIPLADWNYTVYRKFSPDKAGGVFIMTAQTGKDLLIHIQTVFLGEMLLKDKNSESFLEGKALPLDRQDALQYGRLWNTYLSGMGTPPFLRSRIVNVVEAGILGLSD